MPEVFVKKSKKAEPGFSVLTVMNQKETKGEVGIEIEVEGRRLPKEAPDVPAPWGYHHDGSLRGADNAEYVLQKPIAFSDVPGALEKLWAAFKANNSILDDSNRTSVHVHLNCQNFHFNRLTSLMALYFAFEEPLTAWCGEHRVGNLFCLRGKDAPALVSQIKEFIKNDGRVKLREHLHYGGLNPNALQKFGSLEFRTLRGCSDPQVILDWVSILERLYTLSAEFQDPRDICGMFSGEGPVPFFDNVLGGMADVVRAGLPTWGYEEIRDSMYSGIRLAQDLCYCRDWGVFSPVTIKADPFGRDARKIMKKITGVNLDIETALNMIDETPAPPGGFTPSWTTQVFGAASTPPTIIPQPFEDYFDPEYD